MNKLITDGLDAIKELSIHKVQDQLRSGQIHPTAYESLDGPEQMYVNLVIFEKRSPDMACKIIADRLMVLHPEVKIVPEELRIRYMLAKTVKQAMRELLNAEDLEASLLLQNQAKLAQNVIAGLMLNSESEEIQLRAASEIMKYASADYKDKRSKVQIQTKTTNIDAKVIWEIKPYSKDDAMPSEKVFDATVATKVEDKDIKVEKNDTGEQPISFEMGIGSELPDDDEPEDDEVTDVDGMD